MGTKEALKELGEIVTMILEINRTKLGSKIKDNGFYMDVVVSDHPEHVFGRIKEKHLHLTTVKNNPSVHGYVYLSKREEGKHDFHLPLEYSIIKSVESLVPEGEIKTLDLNGYKVELGYFRSLARF